MWLVTCNAVCVLAEKEREAKATAPEAATNSRRLSKFLCLLFKVPPELTAMILA